jgi:hypothetical protein
MDYNFQTENNKIKLLMEFGNAVLDALMYERKYDIIPQNVHTLVFQNKVRFQSKETIHLQIMLSNIG